MDEAKKHEIRAWLAKARHDLRSAERLLVGPEPLCEAAGFHFGTLALKCTDRRAVKCTGQQILVRKLVNGV